MRQLCWRDKPFVVSREGFALETVATITSEKLTGNKFVMLRFWHTPSKSLPLESFAVRGDSLQR